jgi:hypothetical protein
MYLILILKIDTEVKTNFLVIVSVLFVIFYLKIVFLSDSKNFKNFTNNNLKFNLDFKFWIYLFIF